MIRHAPNTEHFLVGRSWGIPKHSKLVASTFRKFDPLSPSRCLAAWLFPTCFVKVSRSLRYYVEKPGMRRCKRIGSQRPRGATSKGAVSCSFHINFRWGDAVPYCQKRGMVFLPVFAGSLKILPFDLFRTALLLVVGVVAPVAP